MKENRFKELGRTVSQIGFYMMTIDESLFQKTELNLNIVSFMSQVSLLLNDILEKRIIKQESSIEEQKVIKYLSKKDVINKYHPLITKYSLTQAINRKEIPYSKRGSKYYFELKDIEKWINSQKNGAITCNNDIKYV
jgi:hypothetical protein